MTNCGCEEELRGALRDARSCCCCCWASLRELLSSLEGTRRAAPGGAIAVCDAFVSSLDGLAASCEGQL